MRLFTQTLAAVSFGLMLSALATEVVANAGAAHLESHTQQPHQHGSAVLQIVLVAGRLSVTLYSPAINLLGFELDAHSPEQQSLVQRASRALNDAGEHFHFSGGDCTLTEHSSDFSALLKAEPLRPAEGLGKKSPDDDHLHKGGSHENRQLTHKADNIRHNDIEIHYQYLCAEPQQLRSASIRLQQTFPGIELLLIEWIIRNQQGAARLNQDHHQIHFR